MHAVRYIGKPLIDTRHAGNDEKAGHNNGQDEVHKGSLRDAKKTALIPPLICIRPAAMEFETPQATA